MPRPKFPDPDPTHLLMLPPEIHPVPAGGLLWRVYSAAGIYPAVWSGFRFWGPHAKMRFDHQPPAPGGGSVHPSRGILYGAFCIDTCLAEFFQATREIAPRRHDHPSLVQFATTRPLHLLDLRGSWATKVGASLVISTGPRDRARMWSRAFYDAYPMIDGLCYASSMNPGTDSFVLYDRARDALPPDPLCNLGLADIRLLSVLANAADKLGYGLL